MAPHKQEMNAEILLIDDDPALLAILSLGLARKGFSVTTARSGEAGLRRAYQTHPDVVILDIIMAQMDGWTTCERLRQVTDAAIIMLTARSDKADAVKGLSLGADDYLVKPCSFEELTARIRRLLCRKGNVGYEEEAVYDDGRLHIDLRDGTVTRAGDVIPLSPTESRLLLCLVTRRGRIVSHDELLTQVWGSERAGNRNLLNVYVRQLRRKIEEDPGRPRYIRTRWKMGYYFGGQDAG